ncbi:MAG: DUF4198 domain-containing protein [Proteobacteria bacterium]|nr:DUF4198 domain-containing protein [Pseudomonadota bacterium]
MKNILFILLLINIFIFIFLNAYADETLPVYYWQLIDQDRYIYPSDMEHMNWLEIRKLRKQYGTANQDPNLFKLNVLSLGNNISTSGSQNKGMPDSAVAMIRDPNGKIQLFPDIADVSNIIKIPKDDNLIGRYLLGIHIALGNRDIDNDGKQESVHLCAKYLMSHYKNGGNMGGTSVVFFDDAKHMPLEIGPAINTAKSKFGGGMQRIHNTYEMMVKYMNRPLPGAKVTVIAEDSQWQKTFVTDEKGKFEVIPTEDRFVLRDWQNYLYIATHHDIKQNAYYLTTLPVMVYGNQPEWRSRSLGFVYWSIIGSGICLLIVFGFVRRNKWHNNRNLIIFEKYKIKKNLP